MATQWPTMQDANVKDFIEIGLADDEDVPEPGCMEREWAYIQLGKWLQTDTEEGNGAFECLQFHVSQVAQQPGALEATVGTWRWDAERPQPAEDHRVPQSLGEAADHLRAVTLVWLQPGELSNSIEECLNVILRIEASRTAEDRGDAAEAAAPTR